jgi:hypothetical protein
VSKTNNATAPVTVVDDSPADNPDVTDGTNQPEPDIDGQGQAVDDQQGTAGQAEPPTDSGQGEPSGQEPNILEFFDPKQVPEELMPAYKNMQAAFTSKTQAIASDKQKIQQFDAIMANPLGEIQRYASQHGYQLVPQGQQANPGGQPNEEFDPKTWDEVAEFMENRIMSKFQGNIQPLVDSVQSITQGNIEKQLAAIDPNWKLYENEMKEELRTHPTLAKNVDKLYRLAVPEHVLSQKAVQSALKKMENKAKGTLVHGASSPKTTTPEKSRETFKEVVAWAKDQLDKGKGVH